MSRNTLVVNMRFIDAAVSRLKTESIHESIVNTVSTDGKNIFYNPSFILDCYKNNGSNSITRSYLHMILHCVFRHNIVKSLIDQLRWNLACDIAVENIINNLNCSAADTGAANEQLKIITHLKKKVKYITAEKLYDYFINDGENESTLIKWTLLFTGDEHNIWYIKDSPVRKKQNDNSDSDSDKSSSDGSDSDSDNSSKNSSDSGSSDGSDGDSDNSSSGNSDSNSDSSSDDFINARNMLEKDWKDISEKMQTDLETFSKRQGDTAGDLIQNLAAVNREKYDYTSFLKKFSVLGETMKINDDEFDYIFYTYGMNMYGKMPLIEPLEYKEVKRIKEFVIAIDTSGSVSGELVQLFMQKTYNILKQEESFFTKINLHIIQCDTEIHEDAKITSQEEFDEYIKTMKLKGFGGTDFRPVFSYVDMLIKNREFTNLKGLIYFTDGYGDFPSHQPDYNTAFVFIDDEYNNPDVPVWAIKLVLQSNEI